MTTNDHLQLLDGAPTPAVIMTVWAESAAELMTTNLITLEVDASVTAAFRALGPDGPSGAPVLDAQGALVGVVSRTDLVRVVSEHLEDAPEERCALESLTIGEVMTPAVLCATERTGSALIIAQMLERDVSRIVVLDRDNRVVGVVTPVDILTNTQT